MISTPLSAHIYPYTTLFRSKSTPVSKTATRIPSPFVLFQAISAPTALSPQSTKSFRYAEAENTSLTVFIESPPVRLPCIRSEEHTSEIQSRENLVCRLQLEK